MLRRRRGSAAPSHYHTQFAPHCARTHTNGTVLTQVEGITDAGGAFALVWSVPPSPRPPLHTRHSQLLLPRCSGWALWLTAQTGWTTLPISSWWTLSISLRSVTCLTSRPYLVALLSRDGRLVSVFNLRARLEGVWGITIDERRHVFTAHCRYTNTSQNPLPDYC